MKTRILLLAASRLSPMMVLYQIRRAVRDRLVPRFPWTYRAYLARATLRAPALASHIHLPEDLATFIAAFYQQSAAAMADAAAGRFCLMGECVDFGSVAAIDWEHRLPAENDHHLWRMKLCQLEVLHSLIASGAAEHRATAMALIDRFEQASAFDRADIFKTLWSPYGASHRMLAMLSGLACAARAGSLDPALQERALTFIRRDAAFVRLNVEHELCNNHTERNLAALCLYGMMADAVPYAWARRLDLEVATLVRALILPDGAQIERSAMYQGLAVMSLRIFAAAPFLSDATRALAADRALAAAAAWAFMTHADGDIALFNDSWTNEVPSVTSLLGQIATPPSLPDAGYMRLSGSGYDMWMDAGPIGPAWNPGHGHADFLAVEVDVGGRRFIVDPGTSQYSTGDRRMFERSAASHNGPRYEGGEPVEYLGCFKVGRMSRAHAIDATGLADLGFDLVGGGLTVIQGDLQRVAVHVVDCGLLIVDRWSRRDRPGCARFLVPATWSITAADDRAVLFCCDDVAVRLTSVTGRIGCIGNGEWSRRYMVREDAHIIEIEPEPAGAGQVSALLLASGPLPPKAAMDRLVKQCANLDEVLR